MMSEKHIWNILSDYFKRKGILQPQIDTFNFFIDNGISRIVTEEPEIVILGDTGKDKKFDKYKISFSDIYIPSPTIIEETRELRGIFPCEARQRDLTYDSPIYATVTETLEIEGQKPDITKHLRVVLGRIPIMLRSSRCYLSKMTPEERIKAGECEYDNGGYFIVKGKERVLVSQLRCIYNVPLVIRQKPNDKYKYTCEMRSMSEETGHSVAIQAMIGNDEHTLSFSLPYIKNTIPMGVVFKALGFETGQFSELIGLSCEKMDEYVRIIINDSFFVEEDDGGLQFYIEENLDAEKNTAKSLTEKWNNLFCESDRKKWAIKAARHNALKYIGSHATNPLKDTERKNYAEQVVENEIFPHMGITSTVNDKARLLGHMVHKLFATFFEMRDPDDRDNYVYKRVESPGVLCYELFKQLFKKYTSSIIANIEKKKQIPDAMSIITRLTDITKGFRHCFGTGNWGVPKNSYVRVGVAQILSRLSYGATLSAMRRISIPGAKESKNSAVRQINPSQIMFICPVECFDPETPIQIFGGKIKKAKNIIVGDILIDEKENPTKVRKICSGKSIMYDVIPQDISFMKHRVTSNHILSLTVNYIHFITFPDSIKNMFDEYHIIDISISEYMKIDLEYRKFFVLFKQYQKFENKIEQSTFELKEAGTGPFVGWQLEGNGRFKLADGTISHNTPEGAPVGIVLNLSLLTCISERTPTTLVKEVVELCDNITLMSNVVFHNEETKVFLNGIMIGITDEPIKLVDEIKEFRRIKMIPWDVSVSYNDSDDEVRICSDEGRLMRPVFTVNGNKINGTEKDGTNWDILVDKGVITYIDNMEAENAVIAFEQKELEKYHNDYCEIAPAMMLGVMASIIPFPDHSQCIHREELVYMADGTTKQICNVKVGDEVITFDPETQKQSTTKVSHIYSNKTDKQMFTLKTISGRKITATFDHRFMTYDGWCRLEHMNIEKTLVGISMEQKSVSTEISSFVVINQENFVTYFGRYGINSENYVKELSRFLPLLSYNKFLPVLSRMAGYITNNCCNLGIIDKVPTLEIEFLTFDDAEDFKNDILSMGNFSVELSRRIFGYCINSTGSFPAFLMVLGCTQDKKYIDVPTWVSEGSDMIKREFVAGFHGGCGSADIYSESTINVDIRMYPIYKYTNSDGCVSRILSYMSYIVKLLDELNIKTSRPYNSQCGGMNHIEYVLSCERENLIRYFDIVGYRYNFRKTQQGGMWIEYLKYLNNFGEFVDLSTIRLIILPKNSEIVMNPETWSSKIEFRSTTLFIPLQSITKSTHNYIADITTESKNQSFLCGDTFCVHNSPRNTYQSAMGKQAMSMFALSHLKRPDTITHVLEYPQKPLVGTKVGELLGFNDMPSGLNVVAAIGCYTGFNQEDSILVCYSAVQRGMFWATTYKTHSEEERKEGYSSEKIGLSPLDKRRHDANYGLLDENGIVKLRHKKQNGGGSVYVQKGDVIIGKMTILTNKDGKEEIVDCSVVLKKGEEGYVDRIFISTTPNGYKLVKVVIRRVRIPEIGDKLASENGQKGTIGIVLRQEDMPFTSEGISPDIIINAHCIPSRMTINQLIQSVLGKICSIEGTYGDATPFTSSSVEDEVSGKSIAEQLCDKLGMIGYQKHGNEILYNGMTGEQMGNFFIGPVYYQRLKHLVSDKIHCLTGDHDVLTFCGWKPISEIVETDLIATLCGELLVYEFPNAILKYTDHKGLMYRISNKNIDLAVTSEHRMWVKNCKNCENYFEFKKADEIYGKSVCYKKNAIWNAVEYQFILPRYEGILPRKVHMESWIIFLGIWYAKGSLNKNNEIHIMTNKVDIHNILRNSLDNIGCKYILTSDLVTVYDEQIYSYLSSLNLSEFPNWVMNLDRVQSRILLRGISLNINEYRTSSKKLSDQIQQLCLHANWVAIISVQKSAKISIYDIQFSTSQSDKLPCTNSCDLEQVESFREEEIPVYCLQVPSEIFYVRRNGKAVWTGNSRATGPVTTLTKQPAEGRSRDGGLRFGEMERDCIIAHGATKFLRERLFEQSDKYSIHVCEKCGNFATTPKECKSCGTDKIVNVQCPYISKLVMQELSSMLLKMQIVATK